MYEELAKRMRERATWINFPHHGEEYPTEDAKLMMEAADAIEELMRRCEQFQYMPPPAWIPVTERLPEKYHQVLVYGLNGMQIDYYAGEKSIGGRPLFMISEAKVTHWMPLPSTEGLDET
jgi:hypothetical protein